MKSQKLLTGSIFLLTYLSIVLFLPLYLFPLYSSLSCRISLLICLSISLAHISTISGNGYTKLLFIVQHCSLLTSLEKQAASSLAMKSFWSLKSPSKISVLNIFPPAIMPFGNRRIRRTQKHNTSKLLSAQHSRVAASRSLLSKATLFPWVTHMWEHCIQMHS